MDLSLYLVTQRESISNQSFFTIIEQAVNAGVNIVQLREKDVSTREFIEVGRHLKLLLAPYNVPLIVNDRVDVALAIKAEGVHLGQSDMHPKNARELLGDEAIIGLSVETIEQSLEAESLPINYVGASPIYPTSTKLDTAPPWGIEGLKRLREVSSYPIVAIGGVKLHNAQSIRQAGADGIAVVSAIFNDPDPYQATQQLLKQVNG